MVALYPRVDDVEAVVFVPMTSRTNDAEEEEDAPSTTFPAVETTMLAAATATKQLLTVKAQCNGRTFIVVFLLLRLLVVVV